MIYIYASAIKVHLSILKVIAHVKKRLGTSYSEAPKRGDYPQKSKYFSAQSRGSRISASEL